MSLISFSTILLLCGCLFFKAFPFTFPSHTKLLTNPIQSGDMVSNFFTLDKKSSIRLFSILPASVNGKDDSIRSLKSEIKKLKDEKIKKLEDEITNLKNELSTITIEQDRILIRQQIVETGKQLTEKEKQLTALLSSTGKLIQTFL